MGGEDTGTSKITLYSVAMEKKGIDQERISLKLPTKQLHVPLDQILHIGGNCAKQNEIRFQAM